MTKRYEKLLLVLGFSFMLMLQIVGYNFSVNPSHTPEAFGQVCTPVPFGLLGWWTADQNINDYINKNDGMLQNGATFAQAKVGEGLSLDGSNDYVSVPDNANLDVLNEISIDAWVKPSKGGVTILDKTGSGDSANYRFFLGSAGNASDRRLGFWNGNTFVHSVKHIPANEFSHVAMTFSQTEGFEGREKTLKFYINGVLDSVRAIRFGAVNDGPLRIGSDINGRFFQGIIDEVEIFKRELYQTEIQRIYDSGPLGKCKPLLSQDTKIISAKVGSISVATGQTLLPLGPITFSFTGTAPGRVEGYECSINDSAFKLCTSPTTYSLNELGYCRTPETCVEYNSNFKVRAIGQGGSRDPSPANFDWSFINKRVDAHPVGCDQLFNQDSPLFGVDYRTLFTTFADGVPAWINVNKEIRYVDAIGRVEASYVTDKDAPPTHDSHDQNTDIFLDAGQDYLLSAAPLQRNGRDALGTEWEIGTYVNEKFNSSPQRYFPSWAWPSIGDRVWVNGNWVFDCGEPRPEGIWTEIHPIRAIASMRDQVLNGKLPGTGSTPVRVTATDLFIHGLGGPIPIGLNCNPEYIIGNMGNCPILEVPASRFDSRIYDSPYYTTPIDEDYSFEIIPPPLNPDLKSAFLEVSWENGPCEASISQFGGKCITNIDPIVEIIPGDIPRSENQNPSTVTKVRVTIPLEGTGIQPKDIYAKKIYVGWVSPSDNLRHFVLQPNYFVLHETMETVRVCECSFFWMNVNKAGQNEWIRLVDFAHDPAKMDNLDNEAGEANPCENDNTICFPNAYFDYYLYDGMQVNMFTNGYDQDCIDDDSDPLFGVYRFSIFRFADCFGLSLGGDVELTITKFHLENGHNDKFAESRYTLGPENNYGIGRKILVGGALGAGIVTYSKDGAFQNRWGAGHPDDAHQSLGQNAEGIAFDSQDNLYVVDQRCHYDGENCNPVAPRMLVFDKERKLRSQIDLLMEKPTSIAIDSQKNIYIVDNQLSSIFKFNPSGTVLHKWAGQAQDDSAGIHNLQGIAVDSADNVYVFDDASKFTSRWFQLPRILVFDKDGNFLKKIDTAPQTIGVPLTRTTNIALDAIGSIYVVTNPTGLSTSSDAFSKILKFRTDGTLERSWIVRSGQENLRLGLPSVLGIATDSSSNLLAIYNLNLGQKRLLKFDQNGQLAQQTDITGQAFRATNIAIDSTDNNYIVDDVFYPGQYELFYNVRELPTSPGGAFAEDLADLRVEKTCSTTSNVSASCAITVSNPVGPALPRHVLVKDNLTSTNNSTNYKITEAEYVIMDKHVPNSKHVPDTISGICDVTEFSKFSCNLNTIPVGGNATISINISATDPGIYKNTASLISNTVDLNPFNNRAESNFTLGEQLPQPTSSQVTQPKPFQSGSNEFAFLNPSDPDNSPIQVLMRFSKPLSKETVIPGQTIKFLAQTNPNANISLHWNDNSTLVLTTLDTSSKLRGATSDLNFRIILIGNGTNPIRDEDGNALDGDGNGTMGGDYWSTFSRVG